MVKKKPATESCFTVYLERTILQGATVNCRVTARLDKTKIGLIKNSAMDLAECLSDDDWSDLDVEVKVADIDEFIGHVKTCPHCEKVINKTPHILNLGEVND